MKTHNSNHPVALALGLAMATLSFPVSAIDIIAPLPEPGTMMLLLGGVAAGVLVWRNRRK